MSGQLIPYPQFIAGSYAPRSKAADVEITRNLFVEKVESQAGKNAAQVVFYRKPGYKLLYTLPTGPNQGGYRLNNRVWRVAGNVVYEIFQDFTFAARGNINAPPNGQYLTFAANSAGSVPASGTGDQIMIVSPPNAWIVDNLANTVTQVTDSEFVAAQTGTMVDGFLVANVPNSSKWQTSNFEDGLTWPGLLQQNTSDYPDNLLAVDNFYHYLLLFGLTRSEVYVNSGSNSALWVRYEGSYTYQGIAAIWSRVKIANSIYYIAQNENGTGIWVKLENFVPKRMSNHGIEDAMQAYPRIDDCYAYGVQIGGHHLVVAHFPSANNGEGDTWVYDENTDYWVQWGSWNVNTASYGCEIGRFHTFEFGLHAVGDFRNGNVYDMSQNYATDNGAMLRWMRRAPHLYAQNVRLAYWQLIFDMQVGSADQGAAPVIGYRWSEDGGETWSNEGTASTGAVGRFKQRVTTDGMGAGRDHVFEVFGSDPTPEMCMSNAWLFVEKLKN